MAESENLIIEKSSVIAILNENDSYWLAKVINVDDEKKNIEIQYFDDNTFRIENTSTEIVERASILCTFGRIHHSCRQFKLSDVLQAKLVKQVAETRHFLANRTNNNLPQQADAIQELQKIITTLNMKIERTEKAYCIMAQIADSLLMNVYLSEVDNTDHRPSKTTLSIINLIESGAINEEAMVTLLVSSHDRPDKRQQRNTVYILANLCFNRLSLFRALNEEIQMKKEEIKEFFRLFCLAFSKMISSFQGQKDWEFAQLFTKINMQLLKQD